MIIILSVALGCETETKYEEKEIDVLPVVLDDKYIITTFIDDPQFVHPAGMITHENNIIICNQKNNCLSIYDMSGTRLRDVGALGNAPLEFNKPTGITKDSNYFYVIDANNHRIQVIDFEFRFVKEYAIPNFADQNFSYFFDIALLNDEIYISSNAMKPDAHKLMYITDDNTWHSVSKDFIGYLFADDNTIYALDYLELFHNKEKNTAESGKSELYVLENESITKKFSLPYKNTFMDFLLIYNIFFFFFDINGEYILYYDNAFYISITELGTVYKIECAE